MSRADAADSTLIRSSGWVAVGYGGSHLVSLGAVLVLARLLTPGDFGVAALAWSFLAACLLVQTGGTGQALVHRGELDEPAAASALVFSLLSSVVFYAAAYLAAPLLADVFRAPDLEGVLRVMALGLPLRALYVLPGSTLERRLDFRGRAICELVSVFARVGVSIGLALAGAGVWSLALGQVAAAAGVTAAGWALVPRVPRLRAASRAVLRELLNFGAFASGANLMTVLNATFDSIAIGRILGAAALGLYSVAFRLASVPSVIVSQVLRTPAFAVLARLRDDLPASRRVYFLNVQRIALFAAPIGVTLIVAGEPIVETLLGPKWLPAVPALRILAAYGLVKAISASGGEVLRAFGRTRMLFGISVLETAVLVPLVVWLTLWLDLEGAALAMAVAATVAAVPALGVTLRVLEARPGELLRALLPAAIPSALLAAALALVGTSGSFAALVVAGTAAYALGALVFARGVLQPVWAELRR